mmetsp:Transcript_14208/g.31760  ORF Transcript_14208/g.31760 Transcript_14208/m.31760 type:complete len:514 (-) Transcript_14208:1433-2974(-)
METGLPTAEDALDPPSAEPSSRSSMSKWKRFKETSKALIGHVTPIILLYLALFLLDIDRPPDGPWFGLIVLWLSSTVGGYASTVVGLPPLVGQLLAGIILANTSAPSIPEDWRQRIRSSGLVVILLRSGLDVNVDKIRNAGKVALRLIFLPALLEALTTALASVLILDMSPAIALAQGFILAAVSPAVVVGGMIDLRRRGYGVGKGIPSLVIAAASLDDIVAISAFSMCIGLAVRDNDKSLVWLVMNMPITLCLGVGVGIAGGLFLSLNVWHKRWQRSTLLLLLGLIAMFGTKKIGFGGSGALASICLAATASSLWRKKRKTANADNAGNFNARCSHSAKDLAFVWNVLSEPLLFGCVGTTLNLRVIPASSVPYSVAIVVIGLAARIPMAYLATHGRSMTKHERGFVALSWCPKATVQAALASLPLAMVNELMAERDEYEKYVQWSRQIISVAIISILVTAPLGSIFIDHYGTKWLSCDVQSSASAEQGETNTVALQGIVGDDTRRNSQASNP